MLFQNWHEEFDKFWPEHSQVSKIFTLMGSFWAKYTFFKLNKYRWVIFHAIEERCKFEEKLTCGLKNDLRNLANFHQSTWKSQNWDFDGILLSKVEKVWPWNSQRSYNAKFEEKLTCHFKTDIRDLTNFDSSTRKSKKSCSLIGSFDQST